MTVLIELVVGRGLPQLPGQGRLEHVSHGLYTSRAQPTPLYLSAHLASSSLYDCVSAIAMVLLLTYVIYCHKLLIRTRALELFVLAKQPCGISNPVYVVKIALVLAFQLNNATNVASLLIVDFL